MVHVLKGERKRLAAIPDSAVLQSRLDNLLEEAAKIRILLHVARKLEQVPSSTLDEISRDLAGGQP